MLRPCGKASKQVRAEEGSRKVAVSPYSADVIGSVVQVELPYISLSPHFLSFFFFCYRDKQLQIHVTCCYVFVPDIYGGNEVHYSSIQQQISSWGTHKNSGGLSLLLGKVC